LTEFRLLMSASILGRHAPCKLSFRAAFAWPGESGTSLAESWTFRHYFVTGL
jgi:hypothetical protein